MSIEVERYESYKDSGVEWLGEIPSHWCVGKIKRIADVFSGGTPNTSKLYYWDGDIPWINSGAVSKDCITEPSRYITREGLKNSNTKMVDRGTVLLSMLGCSASITQIDTAINQSVVAFKINKEYHNKFLYYMLKAQKNNIESLKTGGVQSSINNDIAKNLYVVYLCIDEQKRIANYLDKKVNAIDSLIAKKQQLIENLKLSKQALITETVTKGLDDKVPMKDSGVEWIGEIPSHWKKTNVGRLGNYINGYAFKENFMSENGLCIVRIQNLNNVNAEFNRYSRKVPIKHHIDNGDILISWSGTLGVFVWDRGEALLNQHIFKVELNEDIDRNYFVFLANYFIEKMANNTNGTTMKHITKEKFNKFTIYIPDREEQIRIGEYLDKKVGEFDRLISLQEQSIENLKLTKQKLITEVVTGKINVQNLV